MQYGCIFLPSKNFFGALNVQDLKSGSLFDRAGDSQLILKILVPAMRFFRPQKESFYARSKFHLATAQLSVVYGREKRLQLAYGYHYDEKCLG